MKKLLIVFLILTVISVPFVYGDDIVDEEIEDDFIEDVVEDKEEITTDMEYPDFEEHEWGENLDKDTETPDTAIEVPDGITVILDGEIVKFDAAQPALVNNRTMVPMRKIFEALGAEVTWDNKTQTAKAVKADLSVEITIGSNLMYSNGKPVEIDSPALLMDGRTYVPVRFVSNALGATVDWDNVKQIVYLATK